jgi:outer membrane lipoprotein-sorting protein
MIVLCLLLTACGRGEKSNYDELTLQIRSAYLAMEHCSATVDLTADYGERVYQYTLTLDSQKDGDLVLKVVKPDEVAGVTVRVKADSTALEYDGASLETGPLDDEGLSPISAPAVFLDQACEGYIAECGMETLDDTECLRVCYRAPDGEPGTGTESTLWFNTNTYAPVRGEISSDGRCVVTCTFSEFTME